MQAATYSATGALRDGRRVEIRALQPGDRDALQAAARRMSTDSIVRRFFSVRRSFSEREIAYYIDVDFVLHVALVAIVHEGDTTQIVGVGRYIVLEPGVAEVAFAIEDAWQGHGIGGLLMQHLTALARAGGLRELRAEVLAENAPMLRVFRSCGVPVATRRASGVVHVCLDLAAKPAPTLPLTGNQP